MLKTIAAFDRIGEENAFAVLARATELASQGRDIINLGIGQPDFRTPEHIVEAGIKALRDGHHGYTPATGIKPLREAVAADLHKRFAVDGVARRGDDPAGRQADHVHVDPDVRRARRGDPLSRPRLSHLSLDDRIHRRDAGAGADPRGERLRVLGRGDAEADHAAHAASHPQLARQPDRRRHAEGRGRQAGRRPRDAIPTSRCMSDEIYDQMVYDGETHVCLLSYPSIRDRLILLNGWSKTYAMTGWRLGYAVWPGKLYDYARKLAVNLYSCVNAPTQWAGLAALTGPQDAGARDGRRVRPPPRAWWWTGSNKLPGMSCATPKGAFYAFPNIKRTGWKAKPLASSLLEEAGVALIGGPGFRHPGRGLPAALLRQFDREHPARARPHGRVPGDPQGGVSAGMRSQHPPVAWRRR